MYKEYIFLPSCQVNHPLTPQIYSTTHSGAPIHRLGTTAIDCVCLHAYMHISVYEYAVKHVQRPIVPICLSYFWLV